MVVMLVFALWMATGPDGYAAALRSGRGHRLRGELDAAVSDFTRAAEAEPGQARPFCERGAVLVLQARWDEALADYQAATRIDPAYPGLRSYLAELYLYTGKAAEALTLSREALEQEPDNLMHRINIAHAKLLLGDTEEALGDYVQVAGSFHIGKRRSGADLVLHDLQLMRAAGAGVADVDRVLDAIRPNLTGSEGADAG
jgi:tetratricopeptide (TPR) repeat protein